MQDARPRYEDGPSGSKFVGFPLEHELRMERRRERWLIRTAMAGIVAIIVLCDGRDLAVGLCAWVCGNIFGWVDRGRAEREWER